MSGGRTEPANDSGEASHTDELNHRAAYPASMPLKPRLNGPRVTFPNSHLAELLHLIEGNTKIRTDLVSQLKAHFENVASKAAIEAKIKEVAVRQGKTKDSQWRVLPEAWVSASLLPSGG